MFGLQRQTDKYRNLCLLSDSYKTNVHRIENAGIYHINAGHTHTHTHIYIYLPQRLSGCGGLEVACWSLILKFAGSNPTEAVGFFRAKKSSTRLSWEGKESRLSHVVDLRHVKDP